MLKLGGIIFIAFLINVTIGEKLLLCYYGSWAHYRHSNGACPVSELDPFMCTHLIYTFVGLNEDATIRIMDPWLELPDNWGRDNFGEFNRLKKINPALKTIIAIGGWNEGSERYSKMANDPTLRAKFVKEAANFTVTHGFDGFDLDWEYPGQRDSPNGEKDIEAHALLIKEMREEFDKYGLLLTAATAAVEASVSQSYDIAALSKYLHYIHVMSYDFKGSWNTETGHNSALRQYEHDIPEGTSYDIVTVYNYWLRMGAPKEKLIMGLPLYGRTFRLIDAQNTTVGAPSNGPGLAGQYTFENGFLGLNELCEKRLTQSWPEIWDDNAQVPYTYMGNDWITYDDHKSLRMKAEYAMELDLAGIMVWSIETDDFKGICHGGERFAYLRTLNKAIGRDIPVPPPTTSTEQSPTSSTQSSSSTTSTPSQPLPPHEICTKVGYVRDKYDCSVFHDCVLVGNNEFKFYTFKCPGNLYFDDKRNVCNYPQVVDCDI